MKPCSRRPPGVNRWVDQRGSIGLGSFRYRVGATFAGEPVEVVVRSVSSRSSTRRARRHSRRASSARRGIRAPTSTQGRTLPAAHFGHVRLPPSRPRRIGLLRRGCYRVGRSWARQFVEVAIVAGSVRSRLKGKVIRSRHPPRPLQGARRLRHSQGRPRKSQVA